ncbi:MAG: cyclopropane-fatty-acyl-phospholipid synthase family protein [Fimbriimonas sp.]
MLALRDLDAPWARTTLLACSHHFENCRLNWLADAEVSLAPREPEKLGLSLFFTDPFELEAAFEAMALPPEVRRLEVELRSRFDFAPRTWLKLHLEAGERVGVSQYFVIDPRNSYPITTLRLGLRAVGLEDTSRIEPAFESVLGESDSLWAVIVKRAGAVVQPRISCFVLASSVPRLLSDIRSAGYATQEVAKALSSGVETFCKEDERVYVSLDPNHVDSLSIDFSVADQTPQPPELEQIWGSREQRRYLKLRIVNGAPAWTLYRPFAEVMHPPASATSGKAYYEGFSEEIWDVFGDTYQAGPIVKGASLPERLAIEPGTRVLDAGCGAAGPAMELARAGARVWGVTISPVQAALAARAVEVAGLQDSISIGAADYHRLPFANDCFDRVMFMESIGYADLPTVVGEVRRVLASGGLLYIKDPLVVDRPISADEEFELAEFNRLYGQATPSVEQVTTALLEAGFEIMSSRCIDDEIDSGLFHRRMFEGDGLSGFGQSHYRAFRRLPVSFYEIVARLG